MNIIGYTDTPEEVLTPAAKLVRDMIRDRLRVCIFEATPNEVQTIRTGAYAYAAKCGYACNVHCIERNVGKKDTPRTGTTNTHRYNLILTKKGRPLAAVNERATA